MNDSKTILVSGGAGFIGSHTCVELLEQGYDVVVIDDLCNSSEEALRRVEKITGRSLEFYKADMADRGVLDEIFNRFDIAAVIHFAGLKAVGESVAKPLEYYRNNLSGSIELFDAMRAHDCRSIIFSSSATVYGDPQTVPITEECPKGICTNPYGWTKWMLEQILSDLYGGDERWNVMLLRYFNPIGAHPSGLIGEDPKGIPNNLVPYITQVAIGKLEYLRVFGDDYATPDGTGVRDYIHVVDLAKGHTAALAFMEGRTGVQVVNLGTGTGYSVLDVLHAFERVCGKQIPYKIMPRRAGDIAQCYCNADKAESLLGWTTHYGLDDMCADSWRWQTQNPDGYRSV